MNKTKSTDKRARYVGLGLAALVATVIGVSALADPRCASRILLRSLLEGSPMMREYVNIPAPRSMLLAPQRSLEVAACPATGGPA